MMFGRISTTTTAFIAMWLISTASTFHSAHVPVLSRAVQSAQGDLGPNARSAYLRSIGLIRAGNVEESHNLLKRALQVWPDDKRLREQYDAVGVQLAESLLDQAKQLGPANLLDALQLANRIVEFAPNFEQARSFQDSLEATKSLLLASVANGTAALDRGRVSDALDEFAANPLLRNQGRVYASAFEEVEQFLKTLATLAALDRAQAHFNEGRTLRGLTLLSMGTRIGTAPRPRLESGEWSRSGLPGQLLSHFYLDEQAWETIARRIESEIAVAMEEMPVSSLSILVSIADVAGGFDVIVADIKLPNKKSPTDTAIENLRSEAQRLVLDLLQLEDGEGNVRYLVDAILKATGNDLLSQSDLGLRSGLSVKQTGCDRELPSSEGRSSRDQALAVAVGTPAAGIVSSEGRSSRDQAQLVFADPFVSARHGNRESAFTVLVPNSVELGIVLSCRLDTVEQASVREEGSTYGAGRSSVLIPYTFHRYESVRTGTIEAEVSVLISGQTRTFSVKAVHFDSATGTRGVLDTDKQGNRNRSARFPSVQEFWETAFVEFKRRIRSGLEEPLRELIGRVLRNHLDAGRDVDALLWAMWYDNVNPDMQLTTSIFSGFDLRRPAGIPASNIDALDELIPALSTRTMRAPPIKGEALNLDLVLKAVVSIGTEEAGGSGFFVSHDGLLVTNYHVIEGARQIVVETSDGDQFLARLELSDVDRDLALLRVPYRPAAVLDLVRQGPPRLGASSSTSTTFLCFISGPSAYLHVPYVLGSFRMNAAGIPVAWLRAVTTGSPPISRPAKISVASGRSRVISRAISRNSIGSDSN